MLQGKLFQLIVNLSRPSSSSLLQRSSSVPMTLSRPKTAPTDFIAVSTLSGLTGFGPEEQKPELIQDLKKEIPGIFNWALEGLERLSEQEWQMTRSRFMEGCHDEFRRATNPLQIFLEEECTVEKDSSIDSTLLREAYKNYCEERGYKILSDNNLGQELKRLGIERKRKRLDGIRGYVYEGLSLLSGGVPSCP